jgi:hypothetical protein
MVKLSPYWHKAAAIGGTVVSVASLALAELVKVLPPEKAALIATVISILNGILLFVKKTEPLIEELDGNLADALHPGMGSGEQVLTYDHSIVPQEQYYDCGPASTQVVLNGRGVIKSEDELISDEHTTVDGTNDISYITPVLNRFLPEANYQSVYMPNDPPTQSDKDQLWAHITQSIDGGYGLVFNFVAPPSNYPRGVKGSTSPSYGGGTVFHYVSCMGYDADARAVWIADPGFTPFGYWCSFDQVATLIPTKGYCYANVVRQPTPAPEPAPEPTPEPTPAPQDTLFADVSEYQNAVDDSYPYRVIIIRSNDGDYLDHKWAQNYSWCKAKADAGELDCFGVYFVWRPNWQETLAALKAQVGTPHPAMFVEIDLETWGGQIVGDNSDALNATYADLVGWLGDPKRVRLYGNSSDLNTLWPNRPGPAVRLAAYGSNPDFPGKDSHQYTNGEGYGGGLPEGCSPFGNCDMNSADGLSPAEFAAACGIEAAPPPPPPPPAPISNPPAITKPADMAGQISQIWDQLLLRWDITGGRTLVETAAHIDGNENI